MAEAKALRVLDVTARHRRPVGRNGQPAIQPRTDGPQWTLPAEQILVEADSCDRRTKYPLQARIAGHVLIEHTNRCEDSELNRRPN